MSLASGARLAFRSSRNGLIEVFQKSAAGGGKDEVLLDEKMQRALHPGSVNAIPTDWSPDSKNIAYTVTAKDTGYDIWMLSTEGKKSTPFLTGPADEMHGNFSPDGRLFAYSSNETGKFEVYVQTIPRSDRQWQVSSNGGSEPRWRHDGREIYYLSEDGKLMAVPVSPGPSFGVPKPLFQTRVAIAVMALRSNYVPSRDGQRFLVSTQVGDAPHSPLTVVLNWTASLKP